MGIIDCQCSEALEMSNMRQNGYIVSIRNVGSSKYPCLKDCTHEGEVNSEEDFWIHNSSFLLLLLKGENLSTGRYL